MKTQGQVLLLIGSARRPRSISESLGTYLNERLEERGFQVEKMLVHPALRSEQGRLELLAGVDQADLIVLSSPLFADSLPAPVIQTLELIAGHRRTRPREKEQRLVAISNSGFPEAHQNDTAIAICRQFAQEAGFTWAGGLTLGGGPMFGNRPLTESGGMARMVLQALDLAAEALAAGRPVPPEAVEAMASPIIPSWTYGLIGGLGWRWQALQNKVFLKLYNRPYQRG